MKLNLVKLVSVFLSLFPLTLFANLAHAPKNFSFSEGIAVFTDFQSSEYNLTYDRKTSKASAISLITFTMKSEGFPIFDLVDEPAQIFVDGELVTSKKIKTADQETTLRVALKALKPGVHTLKIYSTLSEGVKFTSEGVSSAFWFSDLDDRSFLEAYLPSNFEYDQQKITITIDFKDLLKQKIFTNGEVTKISDSLFSIEFPETYTSSSLYFHTAPIGRYPELAFTFRSVDGRDIPALVYAPDTKQNLEIAKNKILQSLQSLETKYGPYLHKTITVFIAGAGGMEYCGATMTDLTALHHELTHFYFARGGFMPSNGNSGWIDEAVTTWSAEGGREIPNIGNLTSNMAGHSIYRRYTDSNAYSKGRNFIGYLHYKFKAVGGLIPFLNRLTQDDAFKPMTTEEFIGKMSDFYAEDVTPLFKKHVYSTKIMNDTKNSAVKFSHMKMTIDEMASFL